MRLRSLEAAVGPGFAMAALAVLAYGEAHAQTQGGITPPPTLAHELFLVVTGAVMGGMLGPIFQILDSAVGITPGARQMRANYEVQREIAASLRQLVTAQLAGPHTLETEDRSRRRELKMARVARVALATAGSLAVLIGLLWIGQGTGLFPYPPDSFMINQRPWVWYGAIAATIGAGAISAAAVQAARYRYE